jgi:hypothetical protein
MPGVESRELRAENREPRTKNQEPRAERGRPLGKQKNKRTPEQVSRSGALQGCAGDENQAVQIAPDQLLVVGCSFFMIERYALY